MSNDRVPKAGYCEIKVACEGNPLRGDRKMCRPCEDKLAKRAKAPTESRRSVR